MRKARGSRLVARQRLFVYGTLLTGQPAHVHFGDSIRHRWPGVVRGLLYALPEGYPGLVPHRRGEVRGEVLEISHARELDRILAEIDAYEGGGYVRALKRARLDDGRTLRVWCYVLADRTRVQLAPHIPGGDWVAHLGVPEGSTGRA